MPSLNFQERFAALIESGQKCQTIRPVRKNPIRAGNNLYLFTGLRTRNCNNIITPVSKPYNSRKTGKHSEYVICKSVGKIEITEEDYKPDTCLRYNDIYELALADGFECITDFINFLKKHYGLPFEGVLIKW